MSLEQAMVDLTAAIGANTAMMDNLSSATSAKTAGKTPTAGKDKPRDKGKSRGKGKPEKEPWEVEDAFLAACTAFLKFSDEKADRPKLKAAVKPILEHFGVAKFSEIDSDNWEECYGYIARLQAAVDEDGIDGLDEVDLDLSNEGDGDSDDDGLV